MDFNKWAHRALALGLALSLPILVLWAPQIDLPISALFFDLSVERFPARGQPFPETAHAAIRIGGQLFATLLALGLVATVVSKKTIAGINAKAFAFLLCCMVAGPVLVTNTLLKDHWGRARPVQVVEFKGTREFTPPLLVAHQCEKNCSFIAGDPSVGFMLHCLAYLAAPGRRRRILFWSGMAAGSAAGALRIWMGAHFFSDVVFAAAFMLVTAAALHAVFFGWRVTLEWWRDWLCLGYAGPKRASC